MTTNNDSRSLVDVWNWKNLVQADLEKTNDHAAFHEKATRDMMLRLKLKTYAKPAVPSRKVA